MGVCESVWGSRESGSFASQCESQSLVAVTAQNQQKALEEGREQHRMLAEVRAMVVGWGYGVPSLVGVRQGATICGSLYFLCGCFQGSVDLC